MLLMASARNRVTRSFACDRASESFDRYVTATIVKNTGTVSSTNRVRMVGRSGIFLVKRPFMIGAQIPGNAFLTSNDAEAMRPLFEVANRHRAMLFIHHGPRPGDAFPKVAGDTDNARRRNGTLDMQASLSSAMVTLCLTDYLADYPDATVCVHNLGGNIPYEVERMDHRCLLDTPNGELPSS